MRHQETGHVHIYDKTFRCLEYGHEISKSLEGKIAKYPGPPKPEFTVNTTENTTEKRGTQPNSAP